MLFLHFPASNNGSTQTELKVNTADIFTYAPSGNTIVFTPVNGNPVTVTFIDDTTAQAALLVIDTIMTSNTQGIVDVHPLPCILLSCTTLLFAGSGSTITINGTGFYKEMEQGIIHVEDSAGGHDNNGFQYSVQYVSPSEIIATWVLDGDAAVGAGSFIYFVDKNGVTADFDIDVTTT